MASINFISGRFHAWRHGGEPLRIQHGRGALLVVLEIGSQTTLLAGLLDLHELLATSVTNLENILLWRSLGTDGEKSNNIGLLHGAQLRVISPHIALPVWVVCQITGWKRHWVVV